MDLYELPFAKIIILRKDIAEVIMNEGIEIDKTLVGQFHDFLFSHLQAPFSLLVNKVNPYTYDFYAQKELGSLKELNAIAVVAYSRITEISTEALVSIPRDFEWTLKIFSNREEALAWLITKQDKSTNELNREPNSND